MGDNSRIAWTEATWNPLLGCTKVSPGCDKCYAIRTVHRMAGNPNPKIAAANADLTLRRSNGKLDWTGVVNFLPDRLEQPIRWSKPRRIFVNSLSDLFHPAVRREWQDDIFGVMALASQHTFQVLTKRPEAMADYLNDPDTLRRIAVSRGRIDPANLGRSIVDWRMRWPLPNVWVGTSVEDQRRAEERLDHLCRCPAAVRFISAEPLLGDLNIRRWLPDPPWNLITRSSFRGEGHHWAGWIDWVIGGGESGPGGRWLVDERYGKGFWVPTEQGFVWARGLRDQCVDAGVAFFWKQWGGPTSHSGADILDERQWHEYPKAKETD